MQPLAPRFSRLSVGRMGRQQLPPPPSQVSSAVVSPPALVAPTVTPVRVVATPPAQQASCVGTTGAPAIGVEEVLANIPMPSNKASAGKRKGRDPELSQLLKMVLAKLGNDDSDSSDAASDNDVNGTNSSRPRRSHVAPRAALPLVKRRNKGRAPAPQSSPTVVTLPEQSSMLETSFPPQAWRLNITWGVRVRSQHQDKG
ncbi:hypothetical protein NDU88_006076 [Pleurodeles waltl]|uniref:Uncharacterized protein n=1 Tax=Pleurodeles waltl TaxID=8319 RepID=A0AAV7MY65_PLEWA|nr:hypothetical protein NDU88_006076 [Pleurodeles waltl]